MKCTGRNCPMQIGTVDPAHCLADECPYVTKPLTIADRIRAMSDEELAAFIGNCIGGAFFRVKVGIPSVTKNEWLDWLKQEVDE